jgi:hypothetical protein
MADGGIMSLEWNGDAILAKMKASAKEGCHQAAEKIVAKEWSDNIPWEEGILGGSITVTDTEDGAQVSSSGPYAAAQEFDELRHPNPQMKHEKKGDRKSPMVLAHPKSLAGRKAHAGRDALLDNQDAIVQSVNDYVKSVI